MGGRRNAEDWAHSGGGSATLVRVTKTLASGTWPTDRDATVEAAAFARQLLLRARVAKRARMGLCWEFRGKVVV